MKKDIFKSLIALRQNEIPFNSIQRDVELPIDRAKIITIPGVRRCGKSTKMELTINRLIEQGVAKERILWIGFDDERLVFMKAEELDDVIAAYMEMFPDIPIKDVYMFFDELQLIEGWEYFALRIYKSYCKNIYICGSNATMLSSELKSALRGYPLEYDTFPLSFNEYCRFKGVETNSYLEQNKAKLRMTFEEFVGESAFPEIVQTTQKSEQLKLLHGYFDTMILRDLAEHYRISNIIALRYFIKRIMATNTKPASINAIYNDLKSQGIKLTKDDLYKWIDYACGIFLFIKVPKYTKSIVKEQNSLDKYYCIDNGLRISVLMPQSTDQGSNLESAVLIELRRRREENEKMSYYMGKGECDFVIQHDDNVTKLIQVCWNMNDEKTRGREIAGILEASKATGCTDMTIVTFEEKDTINVGDKTIQVVPAYEWFLNE